MRTVTSMVRSYSTDQFNLYLYAHLAKVHLIKHHLVGMADTPEAGDKCQDRDHSERKLVVPFSLYRLFRNALELADCLVYIDARGCFCVIRAALSSSLANSSIGGHVWWV